MDWANILGHILIIWIGLILAGLLMAMVMGLVAFFINERKTFCCCFYCENKKDIDEKCQETIEVVVIIDPDGQKKLGFKN